MQTLATSLVAVEVILFILIYFGCVYIFRRGRHRQPQVSLEESTNAGSREPVCAATNVLVFVPYTAAKGLLGNTAVMSLKCANCTQVFKEDDETLRLIPTCGHVFHPTCLVDPCSVSCPVCQAQSNSDRPALRPKGGNEEVLEIRVVEENINKLSEEVTKKMIFHAKLILPNGKICSPAQVLS